MTVGKKSAGLKKFKSGLSVENDKGGLKKSSRLFPATIEVEDKVLSNGPNKFVNMSGDPEILGIGE